MLAEIINVSSAMSFVDERNFDAQSIVKELSMLSIDLQFYTDADRNPVRLKKALAQAFRRSDIVLLTGGLGGGAGNMTKTVLASGLNIELKQHQPTVLNIKDYYERAGKSIPIGSDEIAMLPKDCMVFPNDLGVVPGFAISAGKQVVIVLPEVQEEIAYMFVKYVFPYLAKFSGSTAAWETARTFSIAGAEIERKLGTMLTSPNYSVALYDMSDEVLIRVTAAAETRQRSANICGDAMMNIENSLGDYIFGVDVPNLQTVVVNSLIKKKKLLAITESGTNAILHKKISDLPNVQDVFSYSLNATANSIKDHVLDISEETLKECGEVSEQVTVAMARAVIIQGDADLGLAINMNLEGTGILQRDKGTCYIVLCDNKNCWVKKMELNPTGNPDVIRNTVAMHALNMIRLYLDYLPAVCPGFLSIEDVRRGKTATVSEEEQEETEEASFAALPWQKRMGKRFFPQKEDTGGTKVRKTVFIAAMLCLTISLGYLGSHYYASFVNKLNNDKLQNMISEAPGHMIEGYPADYLEKFASLYKVNDHIIGWVEIPDTNVKYPVVKYTDNEYYLTHDFKKGSSKHGTPFVDYRTSIKYPSDNILIYGHNMKDNQMFGDLLKYRDLAFYQQHPTINFDSVYKTNTYKILGVFISNIKPEDGPVFDYHNFIDSPSQKEFDKYITEVKNRSLIDTGVDVAYGDELITLSTCTYEFEDARFVVVARKVREGETPTVDTATAKMAANPLMPDVWYRLYGGTKPVISSSAPSSKPTIAPPSSSSSKPSSSGSSSTPSSNSSSSSGSSSSSNPSSSSTPSSSLPPVVSSSSSVPSSSVPPPVVSSSSEVSSVPPPPVVSSSSIPSSEPPPPPSSSTPPPPPPSSSSQPKKVSSSTEEPLDEEDDFVPSDFDEDEQLSVMVNGRLVEDNAYTIVSQIVENETRGQLQPEAMKAQVVATYTYVKYYNDVLGQSPNVIMRTDITPAVKKAVNAVLGEAVYYQGQYANTTYHSTSAGKTTSAEDVWGRPVPYLVSVDSPGDTKSPYYKNTYVFSEDDLGNKIWDTYNIPVLTTGVPFDEWIVIDEDNRCDGGYVGVVSIGGRTVSRGGIVPKGTTITGRNMREQMFNFGIKSTYFDVTHKNGKFTFTTYGYGHGVGMSQYGANGMAQEGYTYKEILKHYYTGVTVK